MSKAFVRDSEPEELDVPEERPATRPGSRNYLSPAGYARLKAELKALVEIERPKVVQVVAWAASNGDRSENGDYLYGKKRLREIDRRVRFLIKRLEGADVVDSAGRDSDQVYFGATVTVADESGAQRTVSIVGVDEIDPQRGRVSWISPMATALLKGSVGDVVTLRTPRGNEDLEILEIRYDDLS